MLVLPWQEAGMRRGSTREEPFIPGPSPHFLGLPSLEAVAGTISLTGTPIAESFSASCAEHRTAEQVLATRERIADHHIPLRN
jgi:hypothetical protein